MKERSLLLTVATLIILFIIVLFASVSVIFENTLFHTSRYPEREYVELDRSIDDLTVVKISHPHPKSHPIHAALNEVLVPELKRLSGSAFQVELYPDSQLGGSESQLLGLINGALELVVLPAVDLVRYESMGVFCIPYLFSSYTEVSSFMNNKITRERIQEDLDCDRLLMLGWGFDGYRHIVRTGTPDSSEEWTVGLPSMQDAPLRHEFFRVRGYTPTYLDSADLAGSLRRALIPFGEMSTTEYAQSAPGSSMMGVEFPRYLSVPVLFLTSRSFWDTLTAEERNLVQKAIDETIHYADKALLALDPSFPEPREVKHGRSDGNEPLQSKITEYIDQLGFDVLHYSL